MYNVGQYHNTVTLNGDLIQRYRSGVPDSVLIENTPRYYQDVFSNTSFFIQDSWTMRRLTLSPGLRWERLIGLGGRRREQRRNILQRRTRPRDDGHDADEIRDFWLGIELRSDRLDLPPAFTLGCIEQRVGVFVIHVRV